MKKAIPLLVVACHLFFLLFLTKAIHIKEKKKKEEKIAIHFVDEMREEVAIEEKVFSPPVAIEPTALLSPPIEEEKNEAPEPKEEAPPTPPPPPPPPEPKKVQTPKKKPSPEKPKPKPVTKEISKPKAKPVAKSMAKAKPKPKKPVASPSKKESLDEKKLASLMQESLNLLEKTGGSKKSGKIASKKIGDLGVEGLKSETPQVRSYESEIALYLKKKLKLLEPGSVKIKLKLSSNGKVESLTILSAESEKNRELVETKVKSISFPPFDSRMDGEKSHTFHVILKSDV